MFSTHFHKTYSYLSKKRKILLLSTSNRWSGEHEGELAKSTLLAQKLKEQLGEKCTHIHVSSLYITPCEGNISTKRGNTCGVQQATLDDKEKNPSGHHRCWASINNPNDELWKISKAMLDADAVIFFTSVRWGQTNSIYQKLIERLTWLENRHTTLGEENILQNKDAGIIIIGQNWNGRAVLETQKAVLTYYGFHVPEECSWNWQYSKNSSEENNESYIKAAQDFDEEFQYL